jgi:ribosomal protein S18 acetylase RimI-like enzyme
MSEVHIREFQFPADYPQVYKLWTSIEKGVHVGRSDTLDEIKKKVSRDPDLFLIAECENRIIGSVIGGYDGRRGLIYHLAVDARFRGQGIGSRLMDQVEERLQAKGCVKSYLLVTGDNLEVENYYQKRGWYPMNSVHLLGKDLL